MELKHIMPIGEIVTASNLNDMDLLFSKNCKKLGPQANLVYYFFKEML